MKIFFLIISLMTMALSCSKKETERTPSSRVDKNSHMGRRERMEQRMEEEYKHHDSSMKNPRYNWQKETNH